jgi:hypothetical protein
MVVVDYVDTGPILSRYQFPEIAPTGLIGRQWTGLAVMRLPDRAGYHRVRTPCVTEGDGHKRAA